MSISDIDISKAQLEPFRTYHFFHEGININLKTISSSANFFVEACRNDETQLGEEITKAHPSWGSSPVSQMTEEVEAGLRSAVSDYALISVFSAFDDFIVQTKAEINRSSAADEAIEHDQNDEESDSLDRAFKMFRRYSWNFKDIETYNFFVSYFRLCRDCVAHRRSLASSALSSLSQSTELQQKVRPHLDSRSTNLPQFETEEKVVLDPAQVLLCSHFLREIASAVNRKTIDMLGVEGFLRSVAYHSMFSSEPVRTNAYTSAQAVLNTALTNLYRARIPDRHSAVQALKEIDLWYQYLKKFKKDY